MIRLRGMTWANPRGYFPLKAVSAEFNRRHPGISLNWEVRSLKDFGDYPLQLLAEEYDLIMFDHPHVGKAEQEGLLISLDDWMPKEFLENQAEQSVGKSHESYNWQGRQYGLAVDAAAQVAACRVDRLAPLGLAVPDNWEDVFRLADRLPEGLALGLPLVPTDCICSFISLCAQAGGDGIWDDRRGIDRMAGMDALQLLRRLADIVHPDSFRLNPIAALNRMSDLGDIVYMPLTFGYSHYSRRGFVSNPVRFANIPQRDGHCAGAILGGVGIGISSKCAHVQTAVDFTMTVASPEIQRGLYMDSGGQPGHRSAWTDPAVNAQCMDFFGGTLDTLDQSHLRPRHAGYNEFQERAGDVIFEFLTKRQEIPDVYETLNHMYLTLS